MGIFKPITDFLFGKDPEIFDEGGKVRHNLGDKAWENWKNRFKNNPENNWRHHVGTQPKKLKK